MAVPQADPTVVAKALRLGIQTAIFRLRSLHAHIEAKFLEDLVESLDMLQVQSTFDLDRPVEAMDLSSRREFAKMLANRNDTMSSVFGTPGPGFTREDGTVPAVIGMQTMFVLNFATFCGRQGIPYLVMPPVKKPAL